MNVMSLEVISTSYFLFSYNQQHGGRINLYGETDTSET